MRTSIVFLASAFLLMPLFARADLAPRPDTYAGPASAQVAGLTFTHKRIRHIGPASAPENQRHPLGYGTYVFITDCDGSSENCSRAQQVSAVGGAVTKIDGVDVGDNVQTVEDALSQSGSHTLTVVPESDVIVQPDEPNEMSLDIDVP